MMRRVPLWLRWSWRDLKSRWPVVLAIACVIALGTGVYAGLSSTATWRRTSNDESFAQTKIHDVRVRLAPGSAVPAGLLGARARAIAGVETAQERLVTPTQVDASHGGETTLVPGALVGLPVGQTDIDLLHVHRGRPLGPEDVGRNTALVEYSFAKQHELPDTGTVLLSGGQRVAYVGQAQLPEHFIVAEGGVALLTTGAFGIVYTSLPAAQRLAGQPGRVNEVVLRLAPGADAGAVASELERVMPSSTVVALDDEPAYRVLYEDIETDQRFWNVVALLVLIGAAFAAFNLISRIVEAQRREIGIGMAMGASVRSLATRPLLVGLQVALIGVVLGVGVGAAMDVWLGSVFRDFLPLPVWRTGFVVGPFVNAAVIGVVLTMLATIYPVVRAVRVEPIEAIHTAHIAVKSGRWTRWAGRVKLARTSYGRMPVRNILRSPRRTLLTAFGIGASITTLVAVLGLLDSFLGTIDRSEADLVRTSSDRVSVTLDRFYPLAGPHVQTVARLPSVGAVEPHQLVTGSVIWKDESIDIGIEFISPGSMWEPGLEDGVLEEAGIVLSAKAVDDLGVDVGDVVTLRHPVRTGPLSFQTHDTAVRVSGIHEQPFRTTAYMKGPIGAMFGLSGTTNGLLVRPASAVSASELTRNLFSLPGVAAVSPVADTAEGVRDALNSFIEIFQVTLFVVLLLATLIAFNSVTIAVDERARDHATMQAFGLRVRTLLAMVTTESVLTGLIGTVAGIGIGYAVLGWLLRTQTAETLPDFGMEPMLRLTSIAIAFGLGVLAVAIAPLGTARKIRRMDISSTLRVLE